MANMNEIISNNIMNIMKQNEKKQIDLAGYLGVSKQVISKMLSGARMINAIELQRIAEFWGVLIERLENVPQIISVTNIVKVFIGRVEFQKARESLKIPNEIANLIFVIFQQTIHSQKKNLYLLRNIIFRRHLGAVF